MTPAESPEFFQVIVNAERCYSIWPIDGDPPLPPGWKPSGFAGLLEVALNQVAEQWRAGLVRAEPVEPDDPPASTID
ncbi:MbtH family NRPS accessory protein [Actinophytocola sp.]|jgi:uncharacterized protein YbdZ (MbtH family)|uniref:MbtH family NRPS accessory protein n=1 Tax=Actinophytocola sp. TaxID=1872138 RepID=UPI002EDA3B8C